MIYILLKKVIKKHDAKQLNLSDNTNGSNDVVDSDDVICPA